MYASTLPVLTRKWLQLLIVEKQTAASLNPVRRPENTRAHGRWPRLHAITCRLLWKTSETWSSTVHSKNGRATLEQNSFAFSVLFTTHYWTIMKSRLCVLSPASQQLVIAFAQALFRVPVPTSCLSLTPNSQITAFMQYIATFSAVLAISEWLKEGTMHVQLKQN